VPQLPEGGWIDERSSLRETRAASEPVVGLLVDHPSLVVVDSSAVVAALCDGGSDGMWAVKHLTMASIAAPELMMFEATNILRRLEATSGITGTEASLAFEDLRSVPVETWPYEPLAERIWQLRVSVTSYDAAYVALAELLEAPLLTLDRKLARATAPRCALLTP
jgi:predicted nucleic acid-binding protein